ncbi:hypothetical protein R3P38DRAFT_1400864 [Favolaschia claudopus]|uniref:Uncharacterized protein n=1 Tax=Favolaschia claudopus TaxID=2862362 RepID=A0AAW0ATA9_9AGAR
MSPTDTPASAQSFVAPMPPLAFFYFPVTTYGILFSLSSVLLNGHVSRAQRGNAYRQMNKLLTAAGFTRHRYPMWVRDHTSGVYTWNTMLCLNQLLQTFGLSGTAASLHMRRLDEYTVIGITEAGVILQPEALKAAFCPSASSADAHNSTAVPDSANQLG